MVRLGRGYPIARVKTGIAKTPVLFDAVGGGHTLGGGTSMSWSHTAAAGALVLADFTIYNATTLSSITYGGSNMTLLDSVTVPSGQGSNGTLWRYKFTDTTGGTRTISVTFGSGADGAGNSTSFKNVTTISAKQTATGTNTSLSQSVTCSANQMIIQAFADYDGNGTGSWTGISGGTNRYNAYDLGAQGLTISTATASATFSASDTNSGAIFPGWAAMAHVLS